MRAEERPIVLLAEMVASYSAAGRNVDAQTVAALILDAEPGFSAAEWLSHPKFRDAEIQNREFKYLVSAGL